MVAAVTAATSRCEPLRHPNIEDQDERSREDDGRSLPLQFFEFAAFAVLSDPVPGEAFAVHGQINPGRQYLNKGERTSEIEQTIRAAKGIRNHCSGQDDGLSRYGACDCGGGLSHRVSPMGDADPVLRRLQTILYDESPIGIRHLHAVDHHHGPDGYLDPRSPESEHFGKMSILEVELSGVLVVFLIEGAA